MMDPELRSRFQRRVLHRLAGIGRRMRLYLALDGLALCMGGVLLSVLITFLVDRAFMLGRDMRAVQLLSLLAILGAITWRFLIQPLRVPIRLPDLARLVEKVNPELHSRLLSAVDFMTGRNAPTTSPALMASVVAEAEREIGDVRLQGTLDHARARRRGLLVLSCVAALSVLFFTSGETMGLWFRRNVLLENVDWPRRHSLIIEGLEDGVLQVPRGDDLTVTARVEEGYQPPLQVFIDYELAGDVSGREQMVSTRSDAVRFAHTFERVNRNMRCRIGGGDARPDPFQVKVVERPRVSNVVIEIEPPAYTGQESFSLREGQTVVEALRGSRIHFRISTQREVSRANLVRQLAGEELVIGPAERLSATEYQASDLPPESTTYFFDLADAEGMTNRSDRVAPVRFSVRMLADRPPQVKMKIRGAGEMLTPVAVLPIEMEFNDVYGLAEVGLVHNVTRRDVEDVLNAREPLDGFEPGTVIYTHTRNWALPAHGIQEDDTLVLLAQASDFDDVSGPNVGESTPFSFRIVSREELLSELNRREQEYRLDFSRLHHRQQDLRADLAMAGRNALTEETAPDAREWSRLSRRQRDHAGRVNTLRMQFEQVLSELRINQLSSPGVEQRLEGSIIDPLDDLARRLMPAAAEAIDRLARNPSQPMRESADDAQRAVNRQMELILANMVKREGFQEAIALLREVMKIQDELNEETEDAIEKAFFGEELPDSSSEPEEP